MLLIFVRCWKNIFIISMGYSSSRSRLSFNIFFNSFWLSDIFEDPTELVFSILGMEVYVFIWNCETSIILSHMESINCSGISFCHTMPTDPSGMVRESSPSITASCFCCIDFIIRNPFNIFINFSIKNNSSNWSRFTNYISDFYYINGKL